MYMYVYIYNYIYIIYIYIYIYIIVVSDLHDALAALQGEVVRFRHNLQRMQEFQVSMCNVAKVWVSNQRTLEGEL